MQVIELLNELIDEMDLSEHATELDSALQVMELLNELIDEMDLSMNPTVERATEHIHVSNTYYCLGRSTARPRCR